VSVILEFTIDGESFQLGQVLAPPPEMSVELERIVPTGAMVMPFVWATGDDHEAFETAVRSQAAVESFSALDQFENHGLYRLKWVDAPTDLIEAIAQAQAVVLEARGGDEWVFRLRFPTHNSLSEFHNAIIEQDIPIHIDRTYTLTEEFDLGHRFDLTQEQREALVLAIQQGYFASPSEVSLDELAEELGITRQAVSKRIRRGNQKVLQKTLLPSVSER